MTIVNRQITSTVQIEVPMTYIEFVVILINRDLLNSSGFPHTTKPYKNDIHNLSIKYTKMADIQMSTTFLKTSTIAGMHIGLLKIQMQTKNKTRHSSHDLFVLACDYWVYSNKQNNI